MVIVMRSGAGEEQIHAVIDRLNDFGFDVHRSSGLHRTVLGAIGSKPDFDIRHVASLDGVEAVHRVTPPYERVLRPAGTEAPAWTVGDRRFGSGEVAIVVSLPHGTAGPDMARAAIEAGADALSVAAADGPVDAVVAAAGDVPVILEIDHGGQVSGPVPGIAAIRLTGSTMFERDLRGRITAVESPLIVDRAPGSTVQEWLLAADGLLAAGAPAVALCDAGSRSLDPARSLAPDIAAIAYALSRTRLPVLADPARAVPHPDVAFAAARAAVGAGARGIVLPLIERKGRADIGGLAGRAGRLRAIAAAAG